VGHARYKRPRRLLLMLIAEGGAELTPLNGHTILWASDDDEDFEAEFGTGILSEDDVESIAEYLLDEGIITVEEAEHLVIEEDSLGLGTPGIVSQSDLGRM
jgi:hypothetical protein